MRYAMVLLVMLFFSHDAQSQPREQWFKSLNRPNYDPHTHQYRSCCDAGDVYKTQFRVNKGTGADEWWAVIDGQWVRIPDEIILKEESIDGKPYLFRATYSKTLLCFVRPGGGT